MHQPEEYAAHWLERSIGQRVETDLGEDPFMRFMYAWVGFNALYAGRTGAAGGDRRQLREFAANPDLIALHREFMEADLFVDYGRSVQVLAERGVRDLRSGRVWKIGEDKPLADVLECIYQVRCNCFHGGKRQDDQRDRDLVTGSFVITANLLSRYMGGGIVGGWTQMLDRLHAT